MDFETNNIEWKQSWRDEWLKWICGFANTQGGVLEIGKNDDGVVVGVQDARRLLTEIPNKINSAMAILADVDLKTEDGLQYLVITVRPYPNPISYHGKYYLRSGATNRELTGNALDEFMLRKEGKTWDGMPVPYVGVDDLDLVAFRSFRRKALASERLTETDLDISDSALIDSLLLGEGKYLKRAAILLFHENPEKWVPGAYVRIGYFRTGADLVFQDELHGSLISMADRVLDLIFTKYFKGVISYQDIQRVETFPVPRAACREAVLNALVHRDYSTGVPIQIKVFPDEVVIYNDGGLPEQWTVEDLVSRHRSLPRNPHIASVFFRSGQIETWGRGIERIEEACQDAGKPAPVFQARANEVSVTFPIPVTVQASSPSGEDVGVDHGGSASVQASKSGVYVSMLGVQVSMYAQAILAAAALEPAHRADLLTAAGLSQSPTNYSRYVSPLVEAGLLGLSIPDKPRSPNQRYVLTDAGKKMLAAFQQETSA